MAWTGCSLGPAPDRLFAQAEQLRLKYEKTASQEAIAKYRQAMASWTRKGDKRGAARAGLGLGASYEHLGLLRESLESYQAALSLALGSPDRVLESEIRSAVGVAQAFAAEREEVFDQAREQCQRAIELAQGVENSRAEAQALNCLGEVAYYRFRPEAALDLYRQAGRIWARLDDQRGQAQTELYQGHVYSDLSRFDQARACFDRARSIWISLGDERELAIVLVADGRLHMRLGEYQVALNKFDAALTLLRPMGDAVWEGSALTGIARVYLDLAETGSALKHWERALQIFETTGLKQIAVDVLMSLGATYLTAGDDTRALSRFERALALSTELGIERWQAVALRSIGVVYLFRQVPNHARPYLEKSLAAQLSVDDPRLEGETRADLGEVRVLLGQPQLAAQSFDAALALGRTAGDRVTQARGLFGLARMSARLGDLDGALKHVEEALSVAESLRSATEDRDLRASYLASVYRYSEFHMDVLMRLHRARPGAPLAPAAFEASERARARSLLDGLSEAGVDLRQGVDPELLKREQALKRAFDEWAERQARGVNASAPDRAATAPAEEYKELEERYGQIQAEIRSRSPRYAGLVQPRPLRLDEIQREVLDDHTVLLEYALGEERSYLWAVSRRDHAGYELPPRDEIERAARRVYERLTARLTTAGDARTQRQRAGKADAEYWAEASRLSEMLLGPVASKLTDKRLLVVADGALQYLPFAALPVPGGQPEPVPMVVEHEIVSLPSASVLALLRRETRGRTPPRKAVAVLADPVFEADDPRQPEPGPAPNGDLGLPRLVATRQEADAILASAPGGRSLRATGFEASRATAMSPQLAQYRIVHFATHGVFNNASPERSGIALSMFDERGRPQDGFLRLHDVYGLQLSAELVVLSACDTALGKQVKGEGLVGVVRGFLYAGAKRVAASLWRVDDEATGDLMRVFYEEMLEKGRTPADALRRAQLSLRRERRWREPFYWAAFVLQGEPN